MAEKKGTGYDVKMNQKMMHAEKKVAVLEDVLTQMQATKKHLHMNVADIKASIHSDISRLLESLRSREVWLLNQVDVIVEGKEEGLRCQEVELNKALCQLSNCLSLINGGASLNKELGDILRRIDLLEIHPTDTQHINFHSNMVPVRQAIHQFGHIDSKSVPLEAFANFHMKSPSLPKPCEDYNDEEYQVPCKTMREEKQGGNNIFNVPSVSDDIRNWLQTSPVEIGKNKLKNAGLKDLCPLRPNWTIDNRWVHQEKPRSTTCSTNQWLKEIRMEDEEDDVMTFPLGLKYGGEFIRKVAGPAKETSVAFGSNVMAQQPLAPQSWLSSAVKDESEHKETGSCLAARSSRLQDWLIDGESQLSKTKMSSPAGFEPCVFKPSSDAYVKENVLEKCMKKISSLPNTFWLASSVESPKLEAETGNNFLEDYAKKIAVLPWLISSRGMSEKMMPKGAQDLGFTENYRKRTADFSWLLSEKLEKSSSEGKTDAVSNPVPESDSTEQLLEMCAQKLSCMSCLQKKDAEPQHIETFNDYMMKLNSHPSAHWLLPSDKNPSSVSLPTNDTSHQDHSNESGILMEEELQSTSEDTFELVNKDGLEFFNILNSCPTSHWLCQSVGK